MGAFDTNWVRVCAGVTYTCRPKPIPWTPLTTWAATTGTRAASLRSSSLVPHQVAHVAPDATTLATGRRCGAAVPHCPRPHGVTTTCVVVEALGGVPPVSNHSGPAHHVVHPLYTGLVLRLVAALLFVGRMVDLARVKSCWMSSFNHALLPKGKSSSAREAGNLQHGSV